MTTVTVRNANGKAYTCKVQTEMLFDFLGWVQDNNPAAAIVSVEVG